MEKDRNFFGSESEDKSKNNDKVEKVEIKKKKKKPSFKENTDKILQKQGINPKDFDKQAIYEARKVKYDEFVSENLSLILE